MLSVDNDAIIDSILVREGGAVAPPDRSGRISRWGITAQTLSEHRGHAATDDEIRNLSATEARDIYRRMYIFAPSYHLLASEPLRAVIVDYAVNSGPSLATKALQHVLGVTEDGILGGETLHAANIRDGASLAVRILAERTRHYGRLISRDHSQAPYAAGWLDRIADQMEVLA